MQNGKEKYIYYYRTEEYVHWYTLDKSLFQRLDVSLTNGVVTDYVYTRSATLPARE